LNEILNEMAPTATLANEVSIDLAAAARDSNIGFRRTAAALYEDVFKPAMRAIVDAEGNAAAVIPTTGAKQAAADIVADVAKGKIRVPGEPKFRLEGLSKAETVPITKTIGSMKPDKVDEFLAELTALPERITFDQWRHLKKQFKGIMDDTKIRFDYSRAAQLKAACENGQAAQTGKIAHKLKSSAYAVGARKLGDLCLNMEQAGKAGQVEALADLLPRFENEMAAVEEHLNSLL